jgi:hypothetical protein
VDVVIWAWRHHHEWNPPQSGQREAGKDDLTWESPRLKKLADGEEVRDASNRQRNDEGRFTRAAEVA